MGVRCPKRGCQFYAESAAAKDAMVAMQEHLREVHGEEDIPDEIKERLDADVKAYQKTRG